MAPTGEFDSIAHLHLLGGHVLHNEKWSLTARCVVLLAALIGLEARAQQPVIPPGAQPGRIEQDVRPPPEPVRDPIVIDRPRFPEQLPPGAAGARFLLNGVTLRGNKAITTEALRPLWAGRIGKTISVADAFSIADAVTRSYRDAGYVLSQAIVPQQDLPAAGATLNLEVVEGFIDRISFVPPEFAARLRPLVEPIRTERPLSLATLERYLLLLNERAGISARANLRPASVSGASDLEIVVLRQPAAFSIAASNRSPEALGTVRLDGSAEFRDTFGAFDRHSLRLQSSGNSRLAYLSYSGEMPFGREGLEAGLSASVSRSNPRTEPPLEIDTKSDSLTLSVSYPFTRSRRFSVDGRAALHAYNNGSDVLAIPQSDDRIRALRLGLGTDYADSAAGINLLDIEVSLGLSGLGASEAGDPQLSRRGAEPEFTKANVYLARLQNLGGNFSALLAVSAQYSDDILVTAEQFGLGGEAFLRAFDSSEEIGDRGAAGKLELRWNTLLGRAGATLYLFGEIGKVQRFEFTGGKSGRSLRSTGLGVRVSGGGLRGFLEVAKPGLKDPVATGSDKVRVFGGLGFDF